VPSVIDEVTIRLTTAQRELARAAELLLSTSPLMRHVPVYQKMTKQVQDLAHLMNEVAKLQV
jgi:hypothetical protein